MPPAPPHHPPTPPARAHAHPPNGVERPRIARSRDRLESLLRDLGPQIRRGEREREAAPLHSTGLPAIDDLLEGGFPGGRMSELVGAASSGRTSLLFSLLARTTGEAAELAAVVDRSDAFDPLSAEAAGVDLARTIWVRTTPGWREALRCTERLLRTDGIPVVALDLGWGAGEPIPDTAWLRLSRAVAGTRAALVVLSEQRHTGSQAELVLEMQPARPHWSGVPPLLEELEARAVLTRHRAVPAGGEVSLPLGPLSADSDHEPSSGRGRSSGSGRSRRPRVA